MYERLLPVSIYFLNSILSLFYMQRFLDKKYKKGFTFITGGVSYFFIQILVFEVVGDRVAIGDIAGICIHLGVLFLIQLFLFRKDLSKQMFVIFSFEAGRDLIKFMVSVFSTFFTDLWYRLFDLLVEKGILYTMDQMRMWQNLSYLFVTLVCSFLYILLFYLYLRLISSKFVRKDYQLKKQENIFLILPCILAICFSVTLKIMVLLVEKEMTTVLIYDTVPATKFWIPMNCFLQLAVIIACVMLFQKLVQYHEETAKRTLLEHQIGKVQKEVAELQDIYADIKGLRHDMRGHLANIALLVRDTASPKREALETYIGKMEETLGRLDFSCQTGNPITDVILYQKQQEARKKQIDLEAHFMFPQELCIDAYDIAVILNNALENAIEACDKSEGGKQISCASYVKGSLFFIEVENDFSQAITIGEESGLPLSSKDNGKLHGIGISNIQRCAKKYRGDIDIVISDAEGGKKFSLVVMLNGKPMDKK